MSDGGRTADGAPAPEPPADTAPSRGHPLLATVIASVLLLLIGLSARDGPIPQGSPSGLLGELSGHVTASVLIFWGIPFAITIRKASRGWIIGSLIVILFLSTLVALAELVGAAEDAQADARESAAQARRFLDSGENPPDRIEPGRGPMSRMTAAMLNRVLADRHAFDAAGTAAGLQEILALEGLTHSSPVLARCDDISRVSDRALYYSSRWPAHFAAVRGEMEQAVRNGELPPNTIEALDTFARDAEPQAATYRRMWILNAQIAAEAADRCRLLAQRRWVVRGQTILMTSRDFADDNARLARMQAYGAELDRIKAEARASTRAQADNLLR